MKLRRTNTWCYCTELTDKEQSFLEKALKFFDQKAVYSWKFKTKQWDGYYKLFYRRDKSFPAGLFEYVKILCQKNNIEFVATDERNQEFEIIDKDISWLRDYQTEAYDEILKYKNGIIQAATGSGKTNCAIALANKLPINWLFVAHKKDLLNQTIERFERYSAEKAGKIGDGTWDEQRFTVATFQSIHSAIKSKNEEKKQRALDFIEKIQGLIVDECHTTSSSTFWQVAMLFENALFRIGLSATPLSKQNKDNIYTMSALGPVRHKITSKELIDREILAKPKIVIHEIKKEFSDFENIKKHKWKQVYDDYIISFEERNKKIVEIVKSAEKPCLVFVNLKKHGQMLEEMINSSGLKSRFVWGEKSTEEREIAIKDLVGGELDVLVVSVIFNEGIDIPELKSVVLACAGRSSVQILQKIGRGSRKTNNKDTFQIFDIFDQSHPWLIVQSKKRLKIFAGEGYDFNIIK